MRHLVRLLRFVIVLAVVAAVVAGAVIWYTARPAESTALVGSGTIEARTVSLTSEFPARVTEVLAEEGVAVAAGDELVKLETTALEAQRAQAMARVDAAEAAVAAAEAQLAATEASVAAAGAQARAALAQLRVARANEAMFEDRGTDDQVTAAEAQAAAAAARREAALAQVDGAVAQRDAARAQVAARHAESDAAAAGVDLIDAQIASLTIASPMDGVVLSRAIEPGEYAVPGAPLVVVGELDRLTVTVYIPEDRYGQIRVGQAASVTADSFPGEAFGATVTRIADRAEFTPRNVQTAEGRRSTVFAVDLDVGDGDGRLKPGMPVDVTF